MDPGSEKGHFKTWPGVTVDAIQCYLPKSEDTMLGHLDQKRKKYPINENTAR